MAKRKRSPFMPKATHVLVGGRMVELYPGATFGAPPPEPDTAPSRPRGGIAAHPLMPSAALAEVVGPGPLTRTKAVAALWRYVVEQQLQDPRDKRLILADDKLRPVFGADRVGMFDLSRLLSAHLTVADGDGAGARLWKGEA